LTVYKFLKNVLYIVRILDYSLHVHRSWQ